MLFVRLRTKATFREIT